MLIGLIYPQIAYSQCIPIEFQSIENPDSAQTEKMRRWLLDFDTYTDDAAECLESIISFLDQRKLWELQSIANYNLGWLYFEKNQFQKSISEFLIARDKASAANYAVLEIASISEIAGVYDNIKQYELALDYYDKAIEIALVHAEFLSIDAIYMNKGETYSKIGKFKEAIELHEKAWPLHQKREDFDIEVANRLNVSGYYDKLGNKTKSHEYLAFTEEQLQKIENTCNPGTWIRTLSKLGKYNLDTGNFTEAVSYMQKGVQSSKQNNYEKELDVLYQHLSTAYKALGNLDSAFHYLTLSYELSNQTQETEAIRATTIAEQQYQFEKEKALTEIENKAKLQRQQYINYGILAAFILLSILAYSIYSNYRNNKKSLAIITTEKRKSDDLLLNILPVAAANELKQHGQVAPRFYENATILFSDFEGFSQIAQRLSAKELVTELDTIFKGFDAIVQEMGIEKIKTIGDAYMCVAGIANTENDFRQEALKCIDTGLKMQQFIKDYKSPYQIQWQMRLGIHTGPVTAGIVGVKKFAYDIWGDAVNISSRMESKGIAGKVNISAATYELVKAHYDCTSRGKVAAKNIGAIEMFLVNDVG